MRARPTPLEFLEAVYCDDELPLSVRMRAAIEACPYKHPKLTAMALTTMSNESFAMRLDRAIAASEKAKQVKMIELKAEAQVNGAAEAQEEAQVDD